MNRKDEKEEPILNYQDLDRKELEVFFVLKKNYLSEMCEEISKSPKHQKP